MTRPPPTNLTGEELLQESTRCGLDAPGPLANAHPHNLTRSHVTHCYVYLPHSSGASTRRAPGANTSQRSRPHALRPCSRMSILAGSRTHDDRGHPPANNCDALLITATWGNTGTRQRRSRADRCIAASEPRRTMAAPSLGPPHGGGGVCDATTAIPRICRPGASSGALGPHEDRPERPRPLPRPPRAERAELTPELIRTGQHRVHGIRTATV